jgi:hypothetical protein
VPAACRISQTVDGATVTPSLVSSPWMRRCPPQWILFRQADDEAGDARSCRRAAGRAPLARVVFARDQPAVPGQQRRWRNPEDGGPAPAGYKPCQRREPQPVSRPVPDPAGVAAQHRVLMAEHEQLGYARRQARSASPASRALITSPDTARGLLRSASCSSRARSTISQTTSASDSAGPTFPTPSNSSRQTSPAANDAAPVQGRPRRSGAASRTMCAGRIQPYADLRPGQQRCGQRSADAGEDSTRNTGARTGSSAQLGGGGGCR